MDKKPDDPPEESIEHPVQPLLTSVLDQLTDIKTILICLVVFVVVQLLLYGGFLFYLLQIRPR